MNEGNRIGFVLWKKKRNHKVFNEDSRSQGQELKYELKRWLCDCER